MLFKGGSRHYLNFSLFYPLQKLKILESELGGLGLPIGIFAVV